jgi:hypothetical protein
MGRVGSWGGGRVAEALLELARVKYRIPPRKFELPREVVHGVLFNQFERAPIKGGGGGSRPRVHHLFPIGY